MKHVVQKLLDLLIPTVVCVLVLAIIVGTLELGGVVDSGYTSVTGGVIKSTKDAIGKVDKDSSSQVVATTTLLPGKQFCVTIPNTATTVVFTDKKAPVAASLTDVSEAQQGGVMAWMDGSTYMVSTQRNGITAKANPDSQSMFNGKKNLVSIDTAKLNISYCKNMMQMFFNCSSLKNIDVSRFEVKDSNTKYTSKDGCIYSKDGTSLIAVPDKYMGELSVADGTKTIEKTAVHMGMNGTWNG